MRIIGLLVDLVYKSLFLKGEESYRATSSSLKTLLIALMLLYFIIDPLKSPVVLICMICILGIIGYSFAWFLSAYILSSMPGMWYALTALLFSYIGLSEPIMLADAIIIYLRTACFSLILLFFGSMISPARLTNILFKLSLRRNAVAPILLWRVMPYGLKSMQESLAIGELKKESVSKRLGPAIASLLEYSSMVRESNYYRLNIEMIYPIPAKDSWKYNLLIIISCCTTASFIILSVLP